MRLAGIAPCTILLACSVSAMASGDEPPDQSSDPADVQTSLDGIGAPAFDLALFSQESAAEQDAPLPAIEEDAQAEGEGGAAGSNPLASVNKLDLIWAVTGSGDSNTHDAHAEGAFMLDPKLKLNYEVHYFLTDVTGSERGQLGIDPYQAHLVPRRRRAQRRMDDARRGRRGVHSQLRQRRPGHRDRLGHRRTAVRPGFRETVTGSDADSARPALPLVQRDIGQLDGVPADRASGLPDGFWLKLDAKVLADWHNDTTPIDGEIEFGKMLNPNVGLFGKGLFGVGSDRPFDWGVAVPAFVSTSDVRWHLVVCVRSPLTKGREIGPRGAATRRGGIRGYAEERQQSHAVRGRGDLSTDF